MNRMTVDTSRLRLCQSRMHPVRSADLAHVMTLVARDTVIASRDIARDLGTLDLPYIPDRRLTLPVFSATTSRMPVTG
ncbi:MAG TPA: hypothetical protein VI358_06655 [Pseudolabrys sp.]